MILGLMILLVAGITLNTYVTFKLIGDVKRNDAHICALYFQAQNEGANIMIPVECRLSIIRRA